MTIIGGFGARFLGTCMYMLTLVGPFAQSLTGVIAPGAAATVVKRSVKTAKPPVKSEFNILLEKALIKTF